MSGSMQNKSSKLASFRGVQINAWQRIVQPNLGPINHTFSTLNTGTQVLPGVTDAVDPLTLPLSVEIQTGMFSEHFARRRGSYSPFAGYSKGVYIDSSTSLLAGGFVKIETRLSHAHSSSQRSSCKNQAETSCWYGATEKLMLGVP